MISTRWRERLAYTAMSVLVAWHTYVMLVASATGGSTLVDALFTPIHPYVMLLNLDNGWQFFSPGINRGQQVIYVVEDKAGKTHTFKPRDDLNWLFPSFIWFNSWYDAIMKNPDRYGPVAARFLCEKHADLHPVAITLQELDQKDFGPGDWLDGKHPLDPEFVEIDTLARVPCPQ